MKFLVFAVLLGAQALSAQAANPPVGAELAFKRVNSAGTTFQPLATVAAEFAGEQFGSSAAHPCLKVVYLGDRFPVQRDFLRVVVKEGLVYRVVHGPQGQILSGALITPMNHEFDYVMDRAGNLFLIDGDDPTTKRRVSCPQVNPSRMMQTMRHSSIEAGGPVAAAGEMIIDAEGKISEVNLDSGHYGASETRANLNHLAAELRNPSHMDAATFGRIQFH